MPTSTTPARITENVALFDVGLSRQDVEAVSALDKGGAGHTSPNPDELDDIPD